MPRSRSRRDGERRQDQRRHHQHRADQPGNDVQRGDLFGVVAGVHDKLEGRRHGGPLTYRRQVAGQHIAESAQRRHCAGDRRRIGAVRVDEDRRRFSPVDGAIEIGRNVDDEEQFSFGQAGFAFRLARQGLDLVVAGVPQCGDDGPLVLRRLRHQHSGGKVVRIGIDRVAEKQKLHDRQGNNQPQAHRVAANLQPFLGQ